MSSLLRELRITGFRGFRNAVKVDLRQKPCLALFAPNGHGKSSLVDAVEFLLSDEGTLGRLGTRAVNNRAGVQALTHYACPDGVEAGVAAVFELDGQHVEVHRSANGDRSRPSELREIVDALTVSPIIRGHELRAFVENDTPEDRYAYVARWLNLGPLERAQKNIRSLRLKIREAADDASRMATLETRLARQTDQHVSKFDPTQIAEHANAAYLFPLDPTLSLSEPSRSDPGYGELLRRASREERELGLDGLRQISRSIGRLLLDDQLGESGEETPSGKIARFHDTVNEHAGAKTHQAKEREKAASAVFEEVWRAAQRLFESEETAPNECPVCATPFDQSILGSTVGVQEHLQHHLSELADFAEANQATQAAYTATQNAQRQLLSELDVLRGLLTDDFTDLSNILAEYRETANAWPDRDPDESEALVQGLADLEDQMQDRIRAIDEAQAGRTYRRARREIDAILDLIEKHDGLKQEMHELDAVANALDQVSNRVSSRIRAKMEALLDEIAEPLNEMYAAIQGSAAVPVRLELPPEHQVNQQRLNLTVDFADNRPRVAPSGYLSDSQLHTLALALRLAAVKRCNPSVPVALLDDVVTSYDADHRRRIVGLVQAHLNGLQLIVVTHDERFYKYLQELLPSRRWQYRRIFKSDPDSAPRFADEMVEDDQVRARWAQQASAANEIRQAEEEWLLKVCREFGVSVRIRELHRPYEYSRSELAQALAEFLKDRRLLPSQVPRAGNRFLSSLQQGVIENFGSHFQDSQHEWGSQGDEQARWEEFQTFKQQFDCSQCGRAKFSRPSSMRMPHCAHHSCESPFSFD